MRPTTSAFTLLEVAFALAILTVGLTAATGCYVTGLRWASEARRQYSAIESARAVMHQPTLMKYSLRGGDHITAKRTDALAKGWFNEYYIVRRVTATSGIINKGGTECDVTIEVYSGGTDSDGELVYTINTGMWWIDP